MHKRFRLLLYICFIVGIVSTSIAARSMEVQASPDYIKKDKAASSQEQLAYSLGVQAYIYGYPLVVMEQTRQMALKTRAPLNQFYYSSKLASPQYHDIVTPNSNTLYFSAWLDLSKGSVVLNVPANTDDRYYTVQMLDAYTNTFRNVSNRTTKNKAEQFTIVGPAGSSNVTKTSIQTPTPIVWLLGRVQVNGEEDLNRAAAFEKQFTLSAPTRNPSSGITDDSSLNQMSSMKNDPLAFYKIMTEQIRQNPPPACDAVLLDQFKLVGIDPAKGFEPADLNAATKAGLLRAAKMRRVSLRIQSNRSRPPMDGISAIILEPMATNFCCELSLRIPVWAPMSRRKSYMHVHLLIKMGKSCKASSVMCCILTRMIFHR